MDTDFGRDFITITDEDGVEYELEILSTVEYMGALYYALAPADTDEDGGEQDNPCRVDEDSQVQPEQELPGSAGEAEQGKENAGEPQEQLCPRGPVALHYFFPGIAYLREAVGGCGHKCGKQQQCNRKNDVLFHNSSLYVKTYLFARQYMV